MRSIQYAVNRRPKLVRIRSRGDDIDPILVDFLDVRITTANGFKTNLFYPFCQLSEESPVIIEEEFLQRAGRTRRSDQYKRHGFTFFNLQDCNDSVFDLGTALKTSRKFNLLNRQIYMQDITLLIEGNNRYNQDKSNQGKKSEWLKSIEHAISRISSIFNASQKTRASKKTACKNLKLTKRKLGMSMSTHKLPPFFLAPVIRANI
ncbi:ATPase family AAA domain-containing protein 2B [Striga asiatica]|uniref:ATPase family AAA domain-containing protein 2B n=1 Tax=Striga asiatica TaxID=4170 RepID=A0A5A7NVB3_STRAF|nr:ATPase family AAA domain-containing protein 2B [Striga asiatica]